MIRETQVYGEDKGRAIEKFSGLKNGKIVGSLIYNYNTDDFFFNIWIERYLIPELPEYSVLVVDFHKTKKTKEIVDKYGHKVLFLSDYSPDFNLIEFFASLKAKIKNLIDDFKTI